MQSFPVESSEHVVLICKFIKRSYSFWSTCTGLRVCSRRLNDVQLNAWLAACAFLSSSSHWKRPSSLCECVLVTHTDRKSLGDDYQPCQSYSEMITSRVKVTRRWLPVVSKLLGDDCQSCQSCYSSSDERPIAAARSRYQLIFWYNKMPIPSVMIQAPSDDE